jgi:tetratricopeptide (TPR) repeat protein
VLPVIWLAGERALGAAAPRRRWAFYGPLALGGVLLVAVRIAVNLRLESGNLGSFGHAPLAAVALWRTLGMFLWPHDQTIFHGLAGNQPPPGPPFDTAMAILGVVTLFAIAAVAVARRMPAGFALTWLILFLLPGVAVRLREALSEHRSYTALAGASLLVGVALARLRARPAAILLAFLTGVLGAMTVARTRVWNSPPALWREALRHAPDDGALHYALGASLQIAGDCPAAIAAYDEALRLMPTDIRPLINRAVCRATLGHLDEAAAALHAVQPRASRHNLAAIHNDLAMIAERRGDLDGARQELRAALDADPEDARARANLARLPRQ